MTTTSKAALYVCPGFYGQGCNFSAGSNAEIMRRHIAIQHWRYFPFLCSKCAVANPEAAYLPTEKSVSDHVDKVHKVATEMLRTPHYSPDLETALTQTVEFCKAKSATDQPSTVLKTKPSSPNKPSSKTPDTQKEIETVYLVSSDEEEDDEAPAKPLPKAQSHQSTPGSGRITKLERIENEKHGLEEKNDEKSEPESPVFASNTGKKMLASKQGREEVEKRGSQRFDEHSEEEALGGENDEYPDANTTQSFIISEEDPSSLDLEGLSDDEELSTVVPEPFPAPLMQSKGNSTQRFERSANETNIPKILPKVSQDNEGATRKPFSTRTPPSENESNLGSRKESLSAQTNCTMARSKLSSVIDRGPMKTEEINLFDKFSMRNASTDTKASSNGQKRNQKRNIGTTNIKSPKTEPNHNISEGTNKRPKLECGDDIDDDYQKLKQKQAEENYQNLRKLAHSLVEAKPKQTDSPKTSPSQKEPLEKITEAGNRLITDFIRIEPAQQKAAVASKPAEISARKTSGSIELDSRTDKSNASPPTTTSETPEKRMNTSSKDSNCPTKGSRFSSHLASETHHRQSNDKNESPNAMKVRTIRIERKITNDAKRASIEDCVTKKSSPELTNKAENSSLLSEMKMIIGEQSNKDKSKPLESSGTSEESVKKVGKSPSGGVPSKNSPTEEAPSNRTASAASGSTHLVGDTSFPTHSLSSGCAKKPVMTINPMPKPNSNCSEKTNGETQHLPNHDAWKQSFPGSTASQVQPVVAPPVPPIPEKLKLWKELVQLYKDTSNTMEPSKQASSSSPKVVPKARCMLCREMPKITETEEHMEIHAAEKSMTYSCLECRTSSEYKEEFGRHQLKRNHRKYHLIPQPKYAKELLWNLCFPQIRADMLKKVLAEKKRLMRKAPNVSEAVSEQGSMKPSLDPSEVIGQNSLTRPKSSEVSNGLVCVPSEPEPSREPQPTATEERKPISTSRRNQDLTLKAISGELSNKTPAHTTPARVLIQSIRRNTDTSGPEDSKPRLCGKRILVRIPIGTEKEQAPTISGSSPRTPDQSMHNANQSTSTNAIRLINGAQQFHPQVPLVQRTDQESPAQSQAASSPRSQNSLDFPVGFSKGIVQGMQQASSSQINGLQEQINSLRASYPSFLPQSARQANFVTAREPATDSNRIIDPSIRMRDIQISAMNRGSTAWQPIPNPTPAHYREVRPNPRPQFYPNDGVRYRIPPRSSLIVGSGYEQFDTRTDAQGRGIRVDLSQNLGQNFNRRSSGLIIGINPRPHGRATDFSCPVNAPYRENPMGSQIRFAPPVSGLTMTPHGAFNPTASHGSPTPTIQSVPNVLRLSDLQGMNQRLGMTPRPSVITTVSSSNVPLPSVGTHFKPNQAVPNVTNQSGVSFPTDQVQPQQSGSYHPQSPTVSGSLKVKSEIVDSAPKPPNDMNRPVINPGISNEDSKIGIKETGKKIMNCVQDRGLSSNLVEADSTTTDTLSSAACPTLLRAKTESLESMKFV